MFLESQAKSCFTIKFMLGPSAALYSAVLKVSFQMNAYSFSAVSIEVHSMWRIVNCLSFFYISFISFKTSIKKCAHKRENDYGSDILY